MLLPVVAVAIAMVAAFAPAAQAVPTTAPTWGNKAVPYVSGTGYWVFVCQSAYRAGYRGDLNKAFSPTVGDNDVRFPDGPLGRKVGMNPPRQRFQIDRTDPALPIDRLVGSAPDLDSFFDLWDTCTTSSGSLGVRRRPEQRAALPRYDWNGDGLAQGGISTGWRLAFDPDNRLEIERMYIEDEVRSYKTASGGPVATPGWEAGWGVARSNLATDRFGERSGDQIRMCRGHGSWADGRRPNTWWKDITSSAISSGGGFADENFSTTVYGDNSAAPFYKAPRSDGLYGDYFGTMGGSGGTDADPDSTCRMAYDGDSSASSGEWYWSPASDGIYSLGFSIHCASAAPSDRRCRSRNTTGAWRETPAARTNAINHGTFVRTEGVRLYVKDYTDPRITFTTPAGTGLNRSGGRADNGTSGYESLDFDTEDNSGVRRVQVRVVKPDGSQVTVRDAYNTTVDGDVCDYRHPVPCAGATGGGNRPSWAPGVNASMNGPFLLNADDLPTGTYRINVQAWDGANNTSTLQASFRVDDNILHDCTGSEVRTASSLVNCGSTGAVCDTTTTCVDPTSVRPSRPTAGGPYATPPTTGQGVFSYGLAFNANADGIAPPGNGCRVIESVISGSGSGGGLSDREKNQIISVTLDFSGFSTLGSSVGTQDLRATFDLPARRDTRYRSALGCPG